MSLMKRLNSTGSCINPYGTPLLTHLPLDFFPLTTTLWAWLFSQCSDLLTMHSSKQYFNSLCRGMSQETETVVPQSWDKWHPLFSPHLSSHLTVESHLVGQTWFPICKSMLAASRVHSRPSRVLEMLSGRIFPGTKVILTFLYWSLLFCSVLSSPDPKLPYLMATAA